MKTSLKVNGAAQAQGNQMPTKWTVPTMTCVRTEQPNIQNIIEIQQEIKRTLAPKAMPAGIKKKTNQVD